MSILAQFITLMGNHNSRPIPKPSLPPYTLRLRFENKNYVPVLDVGTLTKVENSEYNDWDWYYNSASWADVFYYRFTDTSWSVIDSNLGDVRNLDNTFNNCSTLKSAIINAYFVTSMYASFSYCTDLTNVQLNYTDYVTKTTETFMNCTSLMNMPNMIMTNITSADRMFYDCENIQTGILNCYDNLRLNGKISSYSETFYNCGKNTSSGAAELAQIPDNWK